MNQPDNDDCLDTKPSANGMETAKKKIETQPSEISGFNDDDDQHKSEFGNEHRADAITTFVYQDFSNVPNDASCLDAIHSRVQPPSKKLPTKLNDMLSDPDIISIVAWLPHGRSWQILDRYRFTNEVLPKHFDHSNFDSFIRLVNAWGFRRVPSGVDRDSYYHELFLRGMPHLHKRMKRTNSKKAPMESRHQHPNFYKMPLPDDPNTNMATTNEVKAIASSSTIPPSPKRNDISAQGPGGIPQIQGTFNTASSLYHPHHTHSGLERNAIQLPVTSPHILMQGLQQSMSQSNSQQSARMFPPNIVWNPSSNMQFLLPSTAPALTAASSFAPAPIPLPITSFPTSLAPNLGFSPQLFQPQHPSQHWQHLHLPVHNMGAHALSQQPMQSQNASSMTTSSQSQNLIEQCSNQTPPSHPTQTQFWTNLPSSLPTLQYQNPTAAPFPGGNSNNTQDSSAATTSFNLMAGRGQRLNHRNDGDANGL